MSHQRAWWLAGRSVLVLTLGVILGVSGESRSVISKVETLPSAGNEAPAVLAPLDADSTGVGAAPPHQGRSSVSPGRLLVLLILEGLRTQDRDGLQIRVSQMLEPEGGKDRRRAVPWGEVSREFDLEEGGFLFDLSSGMPDPSSEALHVRLQVLPGTYFTAEVEVEIPRNVHDRIGNGEDVVQEVRVPLRGAATVRGLIDFSPGSSGVAFGAAYVRRSYLSGPEDTSFDGDSDFPDFGASSEAHYLQNLRPRAGLFRVGRSSPDSRDRRPTFSERGGFEFLSQTEHGGFYEFVAVQVREAPVQQRVELILHETVKLELSPRPHLSLHGTFGLERVAFDRHRGPVLEAVLEESLVTQPLDAEWGDHAWLGDRIVRSRVTGRVEGRSFRLPGLADAPYRVRLVSTGPASRFSVTLTPSSEPQHLALPVAWLELEPKLDGVDALEGFRILQLHRKKATYSVTDAEGRAWTFEGDLAIGDLPVLPDREITLSAEHPELEISTVRVRTPGIGERTVVEVRMRLR